MKQQKGVITESIAQDLEKVLHADVYNRLKLRYIQQQRQKSIVVKSENNQKINTPSTIDTGMRKKGSVIFKSRRPSTPRAAKTFINGFNVEKKGEQFSNKFLHTGFGEIHTDGKEQSAKQEARTENPKVFVNRAVYYGNVELPYLHSSDAITYLYQSNRVHDKVDPQILINPPPSISPSILITLKSLYLYYTSLDTVRQLGTGWSNLKSLTVMCSYQLKDLSGLSIFPSLEYLFVAHNNIVDISDIMYHEFLQYVDLQDNKLDQSQQIEYLYTIPNLQWVNIIGNPIVKQKEKYRIICQKFGDKIQMDLSDRVFQYQMKESLFDNQVISYQNIQISNNLIKQINDQILGGEIRVGEVWRISQEKKLGGKCDDPMDNADIQLMTSYEQNELGEESIEEESIGNKDGLRMRVTALTEYIKPEINFDPLKKYFYNKIYLQSKLKSSSPTASINKLQGDTIQSEQIGEQKQGITVDEKGSRKLWTTQNMQPSSLDQKRKISSASMKKRLGKFSNGFSKNIVISNIPMSKGKEEMTNTINPSSGLRYIAKRRFFNKLPNNP